MLVKCVNTKQTDWDEAIESCVFAYITSRHETGRKAYLPIDVRGSPKKHLSQQEKISDDLTEAIQLRRGMTYWLWPERRLKLPK